MKLASAICVALVMLVLPSTAAAAQVVISEVRAQQGDDDFVELLNVSGQAVDLSGWHLSFSGADCVSNPNTSSLPPVSLEPGQHLLMVGPGYMDPVPGDAGLGSPDRLAPGAGALALFSSSTVQVDAVGWGTLSEGGECWEGAPSFGPAPSPPTPAGSIERLQGGVQDTDVNAQDFVTRDLSDPQNRAGAPPPPPPGSPPPPPPPAPPPPAPNGGSTPFAQGPEVLGIRLAGRRRVGRNVSIILKGRETGLSSSGIQVDFGEPDGQRGLSACRLGRQGGPFFPGRAVTFRVPYRFTTPGTHEIKVTLTTGGCTGESRAIVLTLTFVIESAEAGASASGDPDSGRRVALAGHSRAKATQLRAPRRCKGAKSRVTTRTIRRARAAILCLMNDVRRRARARPLRTSRTLTRSALGHSRDMARRRFFAHVGPSGPTLPQRLRRVRYRSSRAGENIGFLGEPTPLGIVNAWVESPPHYTNMVSKLFRYAGIGIVTKPPLADFPSGFSAATFTVNFGRGR